MKTILFGMALFLGSSGSAFAADEPYGWDTIRQLYAPCAIYSVTGEKLKSGMDQIKNYLGDGFKLAAVTEIERTTSPTFNGCLYTFVRQ